MTFDEYCKEAATTDIYPNDCKPWIYSLGLAGETGELCDKLKKMYRDHNGAPSPEIIEGLKGECGDVLWYLARFANSIGFTLEQIADSNIAKLKSRKERGKLGGSGDNR